jgi:hypothetical protein
MHIMHNEIGIYRGPGHALLPMALGAMLALWVLGTGSDAHADIAVWVQHCNTRAKDGADNKHPVEVCSYNAKDTSLSVSYEQKSVPYKHVRKLKCKGEGKGFCKIRWDWEDGLDSDCNSSDEKTKVDKGKYLILYDGGGKDKWTVKIADERDPACGE